MVEPTTALAKREQTSRYTSTGKIVKEVIQVLVTKRQSRFGYQTCGLYERLHKMKSPVRPELTTASAARRQATPAALDNSALLQTRPMALIYRG
jgi:hypothetical protein